MVSSGSMVSSIRSRPTCAQLERFCLRGRNRLDDSEKLLGIGYISQSFFAIRSGHFQLVTSCNRFISLIFQAFLRYLPVVTSCLIIWLISQHSYHINDGKVPFFLFLIPCGSNTLVFEQLDIIVLQKSSFHLLSVHNFLANLNATLQGDCDLILGENFYCLHQLANGALVPLCNVE